MAESLIKQDITYTRNQHLYSDSVYGQADTWQIRLTFSSLYQIFHLVGKAYLDNYDKVFDIVITIMNGNSAVVKDSMGNFTNFNQSLSGSTITIFLAPWIQVFAMSDKAFSIELTQ